MTNKEMVYSYLRSKGLSLASACGIMANIQRESSYNPKAKGDSGTSFGLCQWHKSRWNDLKNFCNISEFDINTIEAQIEFMLDEMQEKYKSVYTLVTINGGTVESARNVAYNMCVKYEIPANKAQKGEQRAAIAEELFYEFIGAEEAEQSKTTEESNHIRSGLLQIKGIIEEMLNAVS